MTTLKFRVELSFLTVVVAVALMLGACGWWNSTGKPIARTVADAAKILCELFAAEHKDELQGVSPAEFCAVEENARPFIEAATSAQQTGGMQLGLKRPDGGVAVLPAVDGGVK